MERARTVVLVVDDDKKTVELIRLYLQREGFRVIPAYDGEQALELAQLEQPDVVILDVMLPKRDGMSVCRELREISDVAIIMLTARITEADRLQGLEGGADDYVIKPFSPRELVARVRAVLRRMPAGLHLRGRQILTSGDIRLDLTTRSVTCSGEEVVLTPVELRMLATLMAEPGRVFSREQLADRIYGSEFSGFDRTIDVHVVNLRRKLSDSSRNPRYIQTVFGAGYRFLEGAAE